MTIWLLYVLSSSSALQHQNHPSLLEQPPTSKRCGATAARLGPTQHTSSATYVSPLLLPRLPHPTPPSDPPYLLGHREQITTTLSCPCIVCA
ncbi:hypothetical protein FH972_009934 [Carpinus fangiana]|uniref:Uncharacterized protein n=1 Tax=Carpinus fangiana TaxID=176857 RepID=A0A660KNP3_9ROSI|nr:hypothetical protein FH972_009934 [Carpinus fangiana]